MDLDDSQTLTNKGIDSDNNNITNIVNADIKAAAAIDADNAHIRGPQFHHSRSLD